MAEGRLLALDELQNAAERGLLLAQGIVEVREEELDALGLRLAGAGAGGALVALVPKAVERALRLAQPLLPGMVVAQADGQSERAQPLTVLVVALGLRGLELDAAELLLDL